MSARHFELPIVEEEENERSEDCSRTQRSKGTLDVATQAQGERLDDDVFAPLNKNNSSVTLSPKSGADNQLVHASTQTKEDDGDWLMIRKDMLYQFVPLPPSNTTTPSASQSNLENC